MTPPPFGTFPKKHPYLRRRSPLRLNQHFCQNQSTKMANSLEANRLGWQKLGFTNTTNLDTFPVRVRRQDSTIENVMLRDELARFLDIEMPESVSKYLAYPQFKYNQKDLHHIQGFPEEARTRFSRPLQGGPKDGEQRLKEQWGVS